LFYTLLFFLFNTTSTTEFYTLSLHDALPISVPGFKSYSLIGAARLNVQVVNAFDRIRCVAKLFYCQKIVKPTHLCCEIVKEILRSEEHTSELQSLRHLVCRLLLEKKKKIQRPRRVVVRGGGRVRHRPWRRPVEREALRVPRSRFEPGQGLPVARALLGTPDPLRDS